MPHRAPAVLPQPLPHTPMSSLGPFTPDVPVPRSGRAPWTNPKQDAELRQVDMGSKEPWGPCSPLGNGPTARENRNVSHLQDPRSERSVCHHLPSAPALKASPRSPPQQSQMLPLLPLSMWGLRNTQDALSSQVLGRSNPGNPNTTMAGKERMRWAGV